MYNKPNIIDAREKVRYTILTCQNRNQLVGARQFARNFRTLYGFGLSTYILFPELLRQSRNLYLGRKTDTMKGYVDIQWPTEFDKVIQKSEGLVLDTEKVEILTFTPLTKDERDIEIWKQEVESIHQVFNTLLNK
jgi:hypothetical protein